MENQNQLQVFGFNGSDVRTVLINDEPWWIAKDVCDILGLSDVSMSVARLDDDEKLTQTLFVSGQNRNVNLINESGLYALVIRSNKPEAKAFRKWVTSVVLPSIRKTGSYSIQKKPPQTYIEALEELLISKKNEKMLLVENQSLSEKIEADAPKVQFAETVNQATNSIDMGIVAKMINKHDKNCGKNRLFKFLRDKNILMENNIPYQPYNHYFEVIEIPKVINQEIIMIPKTQVKPNGQHYIINKWFEAFPEKKPVDHRKETTLLDFCE